MKTKNFSLQSDPKLACTCGHALCDKRHVKPHILDKLQLIRDDIGRPLYATSGGRCPYHPVEARKRKPGVHSDCVAVDIACDSEEMETKLKVIAGRHGAVRVAGGAYCGFVHIDWSDTNRKDVPTWSY